MKLKDITQPALDATIATEIIHAKFATLNELLNVVESFLTETATPEMLEKWQAYVKAYIAKDYETMKKIITTSPETALESTEAVSLDEDVI